MKFRPIFLILLAWAFSFSFAQSQDSARIWGDADAAQQYVKWAEQAINEGRWSEALAGLERAADFANVSSDVSFLLARARSHEGKSRNRTIDALDLAINTNRWVNYDENQALLHKARELVVMRSYYIALMCLDQIGQNVLSANAALAADAEMIRLLAFRGLSIGLGGAGSLDPSQSLSRFRSLTLSAMDRFSRDPRPLRIFFEYARARMSEQIEMTASDLNILELALRRLPFLLETDSELAWIAAPFMRNTEEAGRFVATYRAGGFHHIQNRDFRPSNGSIPMALYLGLIDDTTAVEELFSGIRGFNSPLPPGLANYGEPVLEKDVITDVYKFLRSEAGRELFTQKLLTFSGCITSNDDHDGFVDSRTYYRSGVIRNIAYDRHHNNVFDLRISFSPDGVPVSAEIPVTSHILPVHLQWERYPSVGQAVMDEEKFMFRPADFQFMPVSFIVLGGSRIHAGLSYPVLSYQYLELTRRTLVSFCASIQRPSIELKGAVEQIFLERGTPLRAIETLSGNIVSVTEFERGIPVVQYIDLDLDGRMETVRRFHRPGPDYQWPDEDGRFDYRRLIASSQSDWIGEGRYGTGESYLQDGSVIYLWDVDGSGMMNYSETKKGNEN